MFKKNLRKFFSLAFPIIDILISPFTLLSALLLYSIRKMRISRMPVSKWIFKKVGVFPITDHYYEPLFNDKHLKLSLELDRDLPGINWNVNNQVSLLQQFNYGDELMQLPSQKTPGSVSFYYQNPSLGAADAGYLYAMIRHFKPGRIIEIGSGHSTLMALEAVKKNKETDSSYHCEINCIEPYEAPWLEKTGVKVIRKLVEDMDLSFFKSLGEKDILFIDSSHMIRPQGDVLFEFLQILPVLSSGVIIHVHDIFSPRDYTPKYLIKDMMFWNEQYLLEAFLSCNHQFEIIAAVNYLQNHHPDKMMTQFPVLKANPNPNPGSFWIRKT